MNEATYGMDPEIKDRIFALSDQKLAKLLMHLLGSLAGEPSAQPAIKRALEFAEKLPTKPRR